MTLKVSTTVESIQNTSLANGQPHRYGKVVIRASALNIISVFIILFGLFKVYSEFLTTFEPEGAGKGDGKVLFKFLSCSVAIELFENRRCFLRR